MPIAREKPPNADPPSPPTIDVPANNRLPLNRQQLALLSLTASSFLRPTLEPTQIVPSIFFARRGHYLRHPERRRFKVGRPHCQAFPWNARRWRASSVSPTSHLQASVGGAVVAARPRHHREPRFMGACARSDLRRRKEKRLAE